MVKPIKRNLLIHTVQYKEYINDSWTGESYAEPITLNNVRIEPKENFVILSDEKKVTVNSILFHDSTWSTPCKWLLQSKVIHNGREMTVVGINEYYDDTRLHHIEVGLV